MHLSGIIICIFTKVQQWFWRCPAILPIVHVDVHGTRYGCTFCADAAVASASKPNEFFACFPFYFPLFFTNSHSLFISAHPPHRHKLADTVPPPCSALSHVPPGWVPPEGLAPSPPPPPPVSDRRAPPVDRESLPPSSPIGTTCEFIFTVGGQTNRWITCAPFSDTSGSAL